MKLHWGCNSEMLLVFLRPALEKLLLLSFLCWLTLLVCHPLQQKTRLRTRELALQIEDETIRFSCHLGGIRVVCIVGGQSIEDQALKIAQGCEIVIATPGRLLDCLRRRYIVLNQCNYVILDEADRMIDMGFAEQVGSVLDAMPSTNLKPINEDNKDINDNNIYRTTFMFTATMPPSVERLANKYLRNPVIVTIGTPGTKTAITQHVIMMKESEKTPRLQKLLHHLSDKTSTIVFVNTRENANMLFRTLHKAGHQVTALHGGKSQEQSETSLRGFRGCKRYNVLVATNVAGRGIDIPDISHVVNYDMPDDIETYVHRIGRTGRAGKTGVATTFLTLRDAHVFYDLKQVLMQSNCHIPHELARHEASRFKPGAVCDRP